MKDELANKLESLVKPFLERKGLLLVDLSVRKQGNQHIVVILTDKPTGGITLAECAQLNRSLGDLFDMEDVMSGSYILEVNSPGIDRPLFKKEDFLRCINRQVKFFLSQPINDKIEYCGIIQEVFDDAVDVLTKEGIRRITYSQILKAQQQL
ncbi:MAG: ribosome maturation factor RimP [Candidatus Omnitrophica bacterium]|nr:ribosome maturation factor RimP [Candidatus Omnitrophota bacterium]